MTETSVSNFMSHYGVKGMQWGVRTKGPKQGPSKDSKRAASSIKKAKTSSVKALTNKELKELNSRLEMERKFKQIGPKSRIAIGAAAIVGLVAAANKTMTFLNSPAGKIAVERGKAFMEAGVRGAPATAAQNSARLAEIGRIAVTRVPGR